MPSTWRSRRRPTRRYRRIRSQPGTSGSSPSHASGTSVHRLAEERQGLVPRLAGLGLAVDLGPGVVEEGVGHTRVDLDRGVLAQIAQLLLQAAGGLGREEAVVLGEV